MFTRLTAAVLMLAAVHLPTGAQAQDACRDYADKAIEIFQIGVANGCAMNPQLGLHADWNLHYNWCQRDPFERSDDARKLRQRLQATCHGGNAPPRQPMPPVQAQPQYQPPPMRPMPPQARPPRPAPMQGLAFYSQANGGLCIGVKGHLVRGAILALEPCGEADQQFVADSRSGQIALAVQPNLCVVSQMLPNGYQRLALDRCNYQDSWRYDSRSGQVQSANGTCWDIQGARIAPGTPIINYPCHNGSNQQFVMNDPVPVIPPRVAQMPADGSFHLMGQPGLCVDVAGGRFVTGNDIILWTCHGQAPQMFRFDARRGMIRVSAKPDMCLAVNALPVPDPQEVQIRECRDTFDTWSFNPVSGQLRSSYGGLCLDVPNRRLAPGQRMVAARCNVNSGTQKFTFSNP